MRTLLRSFLAACVVILLVTSVSWGAKTIKVGFVDTYTGPAAYFSLDVLEAFKYEVEKMNAKGGIMGRKIEVFTRDDKYQPAIGLTMAKELVMKEEVDILVGTISTAVTLAVSDLAKKEKIPLFVTRAKGSKITGEKGHRYVFHMTDNSDMAGRLGSIALAKKPFQKYWIAGDDYEYGHAIAESIWNQLKAIKPEVRLLGQSWWKAGETDFTPYITQILSAKPDFIIAAMAGTSVAGFQKAAKATGLAQKIPYYGQTAIEHGVITSQGKDAPENIYGGASYLWYYPDIPSNRAFVAEYLKRFKKHPTEANFDGYMTAQFIFEAFKKAGKIETEALIDALEGLTIAGPNGPVSIRACDHMMASPIYFGVTKKSPKYEFVIAEDIQAVLPEQSLPSCSEVLKRRK